MSQTERDEKLKKIAQQLANLAHMPYCADDIFYRLKSGIKLPFNFKNS